PRRRSLASLLSLHDALPIYLLLYAAHRIPEITDSVESIDRAMKWGFNWELGPFERWDAIGVRESVERMQEEGRDVPGSVLQMLRSEEHTPELQSRFDVVCRL